MNKFLFENVDEYQLEITSYCNAACPQCPRNINGGADNPFLHLQHLPREVIDKAFTQEVMDQTRQIFFCGSYGDALMHPDLLEILQDFRRKSPAVYLFIQTNGGARKPEYYAKIAEVIGEHGKIDFNIDGLKDTNHIYRKNTDFDKIITNAEAFIQAGGNATWNFIVFKHNEHQVDEARMLAGLMGFKRFETRNTGRFFHHGRIEEMDTWPVQNKQGKFEYNLELPTSLKYRNQSMLYISKLKEEYGSAENYFSKTEITCDALNRHHANGTWTAKSKLLINSDGWLMPCNFFNHNLYDLRFKDRNVFPGSNDLSYLPDGRNQIADLFGRHNADIALNIHYTSIPEILKSPFWDEVTSSWDKKCGEGRIFECAMTCGSKLHKVWDQIDLAHKTFMVTGGNRGLGKELVTHYRGINVSRTADPKTELVADITNPEDIRHIAQESLAFDVFVNNAFDGPAGESHANFAQVNLLIAVFDAWKKAGKAGHIINIGSIGEKEIVSPEPTFERYRIPKAALAHASKQCSKAFEDNQVRFKTSLISFDRLDTELSRSRENWTGNGIALHDVVKTIDYITSMQSNTCIDEIIIRLNKYY